MNRLAVSIAVAAGAILVVGFLFRRQIVEAAGAVANVNEGTPFEGTGAVGTLGNVVNQASGGLFQRIGEFLGGKAADVTDILSGRTADLAVTPPIHQTNFTRGTGGGGGF